MAAVASGSLPSTLAELVFCVCVMSVFPGVAHAEPSADDRALATLLFEQGRALIAQGQVPEACQKFAESQRLDPSGGTLLNLARCHEEQGLFASAWSEFKAAQLMAQDAGRADRELEAERRIDTLEPRLSRLVVVVPTQAQVPGLLVERDGRELGRGAWSTPIPVDGGEHQVRATAPGRVSFSVSVVIAAELDVRTIEVPLLAVAVTAPEPLAPAAAVATRPAPDRGLTEQDGTTFTTQGLLGISSAALGVVAWAAGGYSLATALDAKQESASDCDAEGCGPVGMEKRSEAVTRGKWATALGLGGAVLVGAGVTLFYFGERASTPSQQSEGAPRLLIGGGPSTLAASVKGSW